MGNLTYILPVENKEKFNREDIFKILKDNFTELIFKESNKWESIRVEKVDNLVMDIYFDQEICFDIDKDIRNLEKIRDEQDNKIEYWQSQINELKKLKGMGGYGVCIETTYGTGRYSNEKDDIDFFLKDYFKGYIFDDGIHPEFMGPLYKRKPKNKSNLKKFSNWVLNK